MEGEDGPAAINNPVVVKAAQEEMGRLDVLVCGQCHSVFHFVEEFQEHRSKEGSCSKTSHFRDNGNNEQKAQVWAFLLWKDSQIQQESTDRDSANSWKLYQRWCKMEAHVRESWVTAGKTIQTFTKINNAKMTEVKPITHTNVMTDNKSGAKQQIVVRKVIRNGQPEETTEMKKEIIVKTESKSHATGETSNPVSEKKIVQPRPKTFIKPRVKPGKMLTDGDEPNDEEFAVEKITAKRYNTKKRCLEYLLKWEGLSSEFNTWELEDIVTPCKFLLDEFDRNIAKQKALKAQQLAQQLAQQKQQQNQQQQQQQLQQGTKIIAARPMTQKTIIKAEPSKPGPSTAAQVVRPMRSSKSKAMDQVKQWCGTMNEDDAELLGKRRAEFTDSDSEDMNTVKRTRGETCSDDEWTGESEEERMMGRSDVIQRAFNRANAQSNGSNKTTTVISSSDLATSLGLQSPDGSKTTHQTPVLVANAKGVVKVDPKQMPNLTSGVYVMSRKEGIIKLDSSPSGKIAVKGSPSTQGVLMVQNRDSPTLMRKQVITTSQANSITPVKVVSKPDGSQVVTQMKVISKPVQTKSRPSLVPKTEPVKIQPKPDPNQLQQIHVVTAVPSPIGLQPRMTTTIRPTTVQQQQKTPDGRPLLPRPALRGTTPTSVLGIGSVRTPVRAPAPKLQAAQQRPTIQKRIISSPQSSISPNQQQQMRPKFTVVTTQANQVVKTVSPVQTKQLPKVANKPSQSLLSPQQKLLMAKRRAQEAVGLAKSPLKGILTSAKTPPARGRAKVSNVTISSTGKLKETKIVEGDGLHMEFQEVGSEESSEEPEPEQSANNSNSVVQNEPDSPPRPFTLCPLTGRIMGPDGEPMETVNEPEPEPQTTSTTSLQAAVTAVTSTIAESNTETTATPTTPTTTSTTTELVLPSLESLTDASGIMRVEMSPGGTTGTIVQSSNEAPQISLGGVAIAAPDLPCLDDTVAATVATVASTVSSVATIATEAPVTTSSLASTISTSSTGSMVSEIKQEPKEEERRVLTEETSNLVTITGEDGVVYQVAGHAEDGQTLLVTRGADGEQQCVYVTTEQQGDDGSVLTLDHAVAEAVAQLIPDQVNLAPQFYVKEGEGEATENQMVMSIMDNSSGAVAGQEDPENQAQVVAQVVQADDPTPGGTRRVVLLLPDGNLMMTEVDEEQYAALELDK